MKIRWLFNPFERIAGWQALFIGLVAISFTAIFGKLTRLSFDGVLDIHPGTLGFSAAFAMQAVNFFVLFLTMWLAGVCFSKSKLRVVDIAGTMALARAPMLLLTVVCFLPVVPESLFDIPRQIVFTLICIPLAIWMIALMYNAYTVSCHLKGTRAVVSFAGALIVAEMVSKLIFTFLLSGLFTNTPAINVSGGICSTENTTVVTDSLTIRQKAENVIKAFECGDFDAIPVYFDAAMKKGLPSGGLKIAWIQANMTCGKFEKADMDNLKETQIDQYDIIEVPFHFQKEKLKLRLAFNKDGTIGGLHFRPIK